MRKVLPAFEVYFYFISWVFGIVYSTYQVYLLGNQLSESFKRDLVEGWSFLERMKDDTDEDWKIWRQFILRTLSGWIIVNYIVGRALEALCIRVLPLWYFAFTSMFLVFHYGCNVLLIFFLQPVLFVLLLSCKNFGFLSWSTMTSIVFLLNFHYELNFPLPVFFILLLYFEKLRVWLFCFILCLVFTDERILPLYAASQDDLKLLLPALMWCYLRCISFYMEVKRDKLNSASVFGCLGYVFYLPCFFMGPIILYNEFSDKLQNGHRTIFALKSVVILVANNIRYLFWLLIVELLLHYVYINALLKYIEALIAVRNNVWIMYGIGFGMGQFFFLKYTVVYGLALTWTKAEGYEAPQPPKCVACICLYSDMWRLFDEGLYLFLQRYIYKPALLRFSSDTWGKLCTSFLCFLFVYIWHGLHEWICIWSFLNFCGIVVERAAREMSKVEYYTKFKSFIGPRNESRFIGIICAPLTIVSAISNFCFFGGRVVAETYFDYIFRNDTLSNSLCLWFFVYCLCQVSLHLVNRRAYQKW